MNIDSPLDDELSLRLKRLAQGVVATPAFDYDSMVGRRERQRRSARRRLQGARATAGALVIALVGASIWRLDHGAVPVVESTVVAEAPASGERPAQPRIVRADTYLAVAALEDHIASVDDALNVARAYSPSGVEVARLERARDELLDSYSRVRYAEMVNATY